MVCLSSIAGSPINMRALVEKSFCSALIFLSINQRVKYQPSNSGKPIKQAVCDRGYCGVKQVGDTAIILPSKALKKDNRYQRDKKRKLCKRRAAIEPIIGHLKSDFRLSRNRLKGQVGDEINALMAACAWNLRKWLVFCHVCYLWLKKARFCSFFGKKSLIYLVQG